MVLLSPVELLVARSNLAKDILLFLRHRSKATKAHDYSVNWIAEQGQPEIVNGSSGKTINENTSRLSKRSRQWIGGRCYDHNFLRFLPIFDEKMAFFSKSNVMIKNWHNIALFVVKNANFVAFFWRKYFKNHNIGT
jgi:hypothetical protein